MPYLMLIVTAVWIICLIDVITTDEHRVRNMPKIAWILLVVILPLAGGVAWVVAGRPNDGFSARRKDPFGSRYPEYDRPGRHIAQNTEADEEFLRRCRERAEEQRRKGREDPRKNGQE
ncbi:PLD nuclease N-terminal domain-containing protein [Hoyosella subflava]|uniref:Membrane protein n=1 Tax=Hoyosella subflava (strain DSM 45089 / JCM 17490 / NBRC 109087 / DQS3-9A1) TaxID=443218 RepID=F6ENR5_HOYSD|nr:PLD nuclease N-terminal domain-containing protein [Hoyosella subflava]AEF42922.1 Membrane protein [Hoyosella subflava DQS3-9A1]